MMRRVVSLWLTRFATDRIARGRIARSHPAWRGKPLVTVQEARGRLELAAVNDVAAEAGLGAGMALVDARAILPSVGTVAADPGGDRALLDRLVSWCGRFSPWAGVDESAPIKTTGSASVKKTGSALVKKTGSALAGTIGGDAAIWLDITGCAHLFGGEARLLTELTEGVAALGFACRAASADTPGGAWAVARYGGYDESVVAGGETRAALEPLPVAALRLPPADIAGLQALGLRHIGDLLPLPRAALAARFGEGVAQRLDQALGHRPETLSPALPAEPFFVRMAFPDPIGRTEDIAAALDSLLHRLCARLAREHRGARRLVLTLCEPDGGISRVAVGAGQPGRDPDHLARLFAEHLDGDRLNGVGAEFGIDALTLFAPVTEALEQSQTSLTNSRGLSRYQDEIDRLTDRLSNRLGAESVLRLTPKESHIPERAVREMSVLDRAGTRPLAAPSIWPHQRPLAWPHQRPCAQPRPPRLFLRPEPVEAVAPVPDDPPVLFRWRRMTFRVARAEGPERLAPEWWLRDPDGLRDQSDDTRDYYRVEDTDGQRFWLYREGLYRPGRRIFWYLHGVGG